MDWNDRARQLLSVGLSAKQILQIRMALSNSEGNQKTNLETVPARQNPNGTGSVCTEDLEPKEDVFLEPFTWVRKELWDIDNEEMVLAKRRLCGAVEPNSPFELYHIESDLLNSLRHTEFANLAVVKFAWLEEGALVFPVKPISKGEELTRNWVSGWKQGTVKKSAIVTSLNVSFVNDTEAQYHQSVVAQVLQQPLQGTDLVLKVPPIESLKQSDASLSSPRGKIKVYSDDSVIKSYLESSTGDKSCSFAFENDPAKSSFWYTLQQVRFGEANAIPKHLKGINQFPFESCLVRKDLCLIQVCRACVNTFKEASEWVLPAFDLDTELIPFVDHLRRHPDQFWVVKPAKQARSAGVVVTNELRVIMAAMGAAGRDKVVQAYMERPLLLNGKRKFDLRTIVIVFQFNPLIAWANKTATYARIAREDFDMKNSFKKQSHLTVSKYETLMTSSSSSIEYDYPLTMNRIELLEALGNKRDVWVNQTEPKAFAMIKQILQAGGHYVGSNRGPPSQGACYGIDWIVDETGQPKLVEVNFCPDLATACSNDPDIPHEILRCLTHDRPSPPTLPEHWIQLK